MKAITRIACRTLGTAGMGVALYDAAQLCSLYSKNGSKNAQEKYLEGAYFNSRTTDSVSHSSNALREKTFELRTQNPLPALWGKIKGGFNGIIYALGNNLPIIASSSAALLGKGKLAKFGAIGTALCVGYNIARNGFGLGRQNPID